MPLKNLFNKNKVLKVAALTTGIIVADGMLAQNTPSSNPFQDTTRTSDVFFQRSMMLEYSINSTGGPLPQRTQFGFTNQALLDRSIGGRINIGAGPKTVANIGFEYSPGKQALVGYAMTPFRYKGRDWERSFMSQQASVRTVVNIGGFGQKNGDNTHDYGLLLNAGVDFSVYFNKQVGLCGGAELTYKQSVFGDTPGREGNLIPQVFVGLRYIPKV